MTAYTDLAEYRAVPADGPTKTDVLDADEFTIGLVTMAQGQTIESHPEPYEVFFFVIQGAGEFTTGEGIVDLGEGDALHLETGERRGIRCTDPLTILAVQEPH